MIAFTPFPRPNRVFCLISLVGLITTLAATVFVAAHGGGISANAPAASAAATPVDAAAKTRIAERFGSLPLSFEANEGQLDRAVKFQSRGPGYHLFLTGNEAVLSLRKPPAVEKDPRRSASTAQVREGTVLRLKMIGANSDAQVTGHDELPGKINYLTGNDPEKWRRNIPTYRKVYYKDVYPGVDVVYYGNQRQLEYDFVIAPGANPMVIKFRIEGADRLRVDPTGSLLLVLKDGEVRLNKPFIYQLAENGSRSEIKGAYAVSGNEVSFRVRGFDARKPLVIDPVLSYSTFLGTNSDELAQGIAVDAQGSAYVTGFTNANNFPTTAGAFRTTVQSGGAFVTKLDPTGSTLVYSTYLSGATFSTTSATSIAVDAAGNAHLTGFTTAPDFPVVNGLKSTTNFFKTTDSAATWLNNSTGLSGDVNSIAVAPNALSVVYAGNFTGVFRSSDGGATWTKQAGTGLPGLLNPVVMTVSPVNSAIVYLGSNIGGGSGLFRSFDGGNSWSLVNLPGAGPFGVVPSTIVFDPVTPSTVYVGTFNGLFRSTDSGNTWTAFNNFTGLSGPPDVRTIAIDKTNPSTMYCGLSSVGFFKTTNGGANWSPINNGLTDDPENSFPRVIVIDPFNSSTLYSGFGSPAGRGNLYKSTNGGASWSPINNGRPFGVVVALIADQSTPSTLYTAIAGGGILKTINGGGLWTGANNGLGSVDVRALVAHPANSSIMYAGTGAFESQDAFVTKLNASGSGLLFSTYLGGSFGDSGTGIAVDAAGNIYVAGETSSKNFPTVNAFQSAPTPTDNCFNGFVAKINPATPSYVFSTYLGGSTCDTAYAIALDGAADVYIAGQTTSPDFPTANALQPTIGDPFSGDAFVTKLTTNGAVVYSTFLGGDSLDSSRGIAVNASGEAVIAGNTSSANFPVVNSLQPFNDFGESDAFVAKLNSQGSALVYSTFLGGDGSEFARGVALDAAGNAHVVGITNSRNFPVVPGALRTRSTLFKSIDDGAHWSNDNYGLDFGINSGVMSLIVHPTQTSTIYAGTLSGVYKSSNGGRTWSRMNNGLGIPRVTTLVMDPSTPSTLYAAAQEFDSFNFGVYKSTDGGATWNLRKNGMGNGIIVSLAIDPVSPNTLYAGTTTGTQSGGQLFKTTDGADNWAPVGSVPASSFISLAVDPHDHTTIYGAAPVNEGAIFKSVDGGATWNPVGVAQIGALGRSVAVSPHTAGLLYARLSFGQGIYRSFDGGSNWSKVTDKDGDIVFDPVSASTVYLLTGLEGVLKSTDNGATWLQLTKNYHGPVTTALAVDPLKPSTLYFATLPAGADDSFVVKLNPAGNTLLYSTFLGGVTPSAGFDGVQSFAIAIAVDTAGNAYVSGGSQSPNFPTTPGSFQPLHRAFFDAFVMKLTMSHIISGHVVDGSSAPVSGADVVLQEGASVTQVTTETDGSYEFSRLREGGTYTVSASKPHFTMAPPSQTFTNLTSSQTLNFTATATNAAFHTIGGQITNNGVALPGVTVTLSGSQSGLRTTDANGNYSFELAAGGNYTLTPSLLGFMFGPINLTFNNLSASQAANFTATRQSFVVTNTNNEGAGSLRDAIINANATVGTDTIVFTILGPGVKTINLVNELPEITDAIVIDATTQPGYAGSPLVEINGVAISSARGLVIKAGGSTVRGLAIGNFSSGIAIFVTNCDNNVFQANYLGLDATGTAARPNSVGLALSNSSNNVIGGTTAAARNVISANTTSGINLFGSTNVVQGNYIGTNAAGTASIGFANSGIEVSGSGVTNNLIGGTSAGAGNVISGNSRGINIFATGTTIQGNLIGTDATGTKRLTNSGTGIQTFNSTNTLVGGLTPGARNIISGNGGNGVFLSGPGSKLQGNFIGTDITGTQPLGNSSTGVVAGNGALIGGTTPEARNVISANGGFGNIALGDNNSGVAATVQGNYIGTDVTGAKALASNTANGIAIFTNGHLIGGTAAGAANVISGNMTGIRVGVFNGDVSGNTILGNLIGLNAQGTSPLPNTQLGVHFFAAQNNTLGGLQNGAANKIAFNGGPGVVVSGGTRSRIRGNSIFGNNGLGIDLGNSGVTANDLNDADTGANNLQNFPVITTVSSNASSTTILGNLNSTPNTTFQLDFYSNSAVDPSGNGEGALFFSTTAVTTDGSGNAAINVNFPIALPSGRVLTATATDPNGNTSEFSAAPASAAAGSVQFKFDSFFVIEDVGTANLTVQRTGGTFGNLSVEYETTNGTALAGQDYTASSGTVNFADGETSKTIQIPITDDSTTEPDETFTVSLKNPSSLDSLGAPLSTVITIQDRTTVPALLEFGASVTEGDVGTTTQMLFEVRLSAATGRTVKIDYATADFTANGGAACGTQGVDYQPVAGTLTFQPGSFSIFVPVTICGDRSAEANESFTFNLSKGVNATIVDGQAIGVIGNDDVIELQLEEASPIAGQAAALDALRFVRDPFPIVSVPELFASAGFDRNTRVMLFVRNLELNPGENSSAVIVRLFGSNSQLIDVFSEDFRPVPNTDLMQVVFRLPNNLPAGTCTVLVRSHGRFSNVGTIRIAP
jgi:hypothetical protein